jgi:hypothetical protein
MPLLTSSEKALLINTGIDQKIQATSKPWRGYRELMLNCAHKYYINWYAFEKRLASLRNCPMQPVNWAQIAEDLFQSFEPYPNPSGRPRFNAYKQLLSQVPSILRSPKRSDEIDFRRALVNFLVDTYPSNIRSGIYP